MEILKNKRFLNNTLVWRINVGHVVGGHGIGGQGVGVAGYSLVTNGSLVVSLTASIVYINFCRMQYSITVYKSIFCLKEG